MSIGKCYNDTERGNWNIGRKKIYGVWGKWMNVYGAMVEDTGGENWSREWKILYSVGGS